MKEKLGMPDLTGRIEGEKMGLFGKKKVDFVSPAGGRLMNITEVEDPVFSSKMLGDGFAVDLTDGEIGAPFDGEVTAAFPTGHAFGIQMKNGMELLVHIGINTVEANGDGFKVMNVKQGDVVKAGQPIVEVDFKKLSKKYNINTMLIITNNLDTPAQFTEPKSVKRGDSVLK